MEQKYATGAEPSPYDIRTFTYIPTGVPISGGVRYEPEDIENQHRVGICTAISITQNARKALGQKFSADFQYLIQKKYVDGNWTEGSAISSGLKAAKNYGLLPEKYWKFTTENDRKLSYDRYIKKLQSVPEAEIQALLKKTIKIRAFTSVPVDRDLMAQAILESEAGLLTRYTIGNEWWQKPIEPLRPPQVAISGHAVTESNYNGTSFRIANTWGTDWADKGTAYRLHAQYRPTECWMVHYNQVPEVVQKQLDARTELQGKLFNALQEVIKLYQQLIKLS